MVELQLDFLPHLKELEDLTKKPWLTSMLAGNYQSTFRGSGHEFETFTQYTPEQDSKSIDWLASAKSDKLLMRVFTEERDVKTFIIFDTSSSMFFSSTRKLKCEYAAELINSLLFAVVAAGDQAGMLMTSDTNHKIIPPKQDRAQYFRLLEELSKSDNYGGRRDLQWAFKEMLNTKDQGIIFVVSDFLNFSKDEAEVMSLLAKKFDMYAFVVRDKVEKYLPRNLNAVCIEDPSTGRTIIVNLKQVRKEYQQVMEEDEARLNELFLEHNIDMQIFYTHQPFESTLMEFFSMQRKKWK